jgi:imidazole glycerol-phosphate synthase subunit HisH
VIALIDYGAGNLTSVRKALSALGADFWSPSGANELAAASAVIVPGVGHFAATRTMDDGWRQAIRAAVDRGTPLLGICLGMQWLFNGSDEAPGLPGLGLLDGTCIRIPDVNLRDRESAPGALLKVPHVGWNSLALPRASTLMTNVARDAQVYFTHSYVAPLTSATVAVTSYGVPFASAIERGHVAGVQFHPEKSGEVGLTILSNWLGPAVAAKGRVGAVAP